MPPSGRRTPKKIVEASTLTDLYGYWPTFHDALVESIRVEQNGPVKSLGWEVYCHPRSRVLNW